MWPQWRETLKAEANEGCLRKLWKLSKLQSAISEAYQRKWEACESWEAPLFFWRRKEEEKPVRRRRHLLRERRREAWESEKSEKRNETENVREWRENISLRREEDTEEIAPAVWPWPKKRSCGMQPFWPLQRNTTSTTGWLWLKATSTSPSWLASRKRHLLKLKYYGVMKPESLREEKKHESPLKIHYLLLAIGSHNHDREKCDLL